MANRSWKNEVSDLIFMASKSLWTVTEAMKLKDNFFQGKKPMTNLDGALKSRVTTLPTRAYMSDLWFFQ